MPHLEVGHLGLAPGLDQRLETHPHQLCQTAVHHLLAEQLGLGLLTHRRDEGVVPQPADGLGVGLGEVPCPTGRILVDAEQGRDGVSVLIVTPHRRTGLLDRHQTDVHPARRLNLPEVHAETAWEHEGITIAQVGSNVLGVDRGDLLVGEQDGDDVGLLAGLGNRHHRQSLGLSSRDAAGARGQTDPHIHPRVTQVEAVGASLGPKPDDGDLPVLDHGEIGIPGMDGGHGCLLR